MLAPGYVFDVWGALIEVSHRRVKTRGDGASWANLATDGTVE